MAIHQRPTLSLAALCLLAACASTPEQRIGADKSKFESYPAETQAKIRNGDVGVGFTPEMVRMAMGEPAQVVQKTTAEGQAEIWLYVPGSSTPTFSIGLGLGSYGSNVGGGIGVNAPLNRPSGNETRVIFGGGVVTAVERAIAP